MKSKMLNNAAVILALATLAASASACVHTAKAKLPPAEWHNEPSDVWMLRQPQSQPVDKRLACTFSIPPSAKLGDPLPLTMSLQNLSKKPLRILRFDTPFTQRNLHEYFHVACDGKNQIGMGSIVHYAPGLNFSPPEAYERIEPGATYAVVLPFEKWSNFEPGHCEVRWYPMMSGFGDVIDDMAIEARPRGKWQHRGVVCNSVTVEILP